MIIHMTIKTPETNAVIKEINVAMTKTGVVQADNTAPSEYDFVFFKGDRGVYYYESPDFPNHVLSNLYKFAQNLVA